MTTYEKYLTEIVSSQFSGLTNEELLHKLIQIGVVDFTLCKVLAIREYVGDCMKNDMKKIDAMWEAAEKFACSYEYVRKCMYYYTDVNVC